MNEEDIFWDANTLALYSYPDLKKNFFAYRYMPGCLYYECCL